MSEEIEKSENPVITNAENQPTEEIIAPENETQVLSEDANNSPETESENNEEDLPPHLQRKIGKIISLERKRLQAQFNRQIQTQVPGTQAPDGMIFDHQIGEYVDLNSVPGQMAWREQLAQQKREKDQLVAQQTARQSEYEELTERLIEGHTRYNNFQQALQNFSDLATQEMADALCGIEKPDAVIAYLGDKKAEIQRISRLKPAQQAREMFRIEQSITPRKKLVTNAPAPVPKLSGNSGGVPLRQEDMSQAQLNAYYDQKFNSR